MNPAARDRLRALPAVDQLAARLVAAADVAGRRVSLTTATSIARSVLDHRRSEILAGDDPGHEPDLLDRARRRLQTGPTRVLNATGVIIHTNLGRAPLAEAAAAAAGAAARGYLDLEYDLDSGRRGARDAHVREILVELTGAEDAIVVNNGAAATLLAAAALAGPGRRIIVSRGQLVEIGGGFRIPDVIAQAGAELVEVGTTNKTRLADYEQALTDPATDVILRVHPSNFRTLGFVEDVPVAALTTLGVPVIDDLGSGVLAADIDEQLADEPPVSASVKAAADVICFSGDKLLGGPQAGILVGRRAAIQRCAKHPLARAVRLGRLPLAALAATLAIYRDPQRALTEIPVLAMLTVDPAELDRRATKLAASTGGEIIESTARVGGGALPLTELHGPAVAIEPGTRGADALAARLRTCHPPLITRIVDDRVIVDPRTLQGDIELEQAIAVIRAAMADSRSSSPAASGRRPSATADLE